MQHVVLLLPSVTRTPYAVEEASHLFFEVHELQGYLAADGAPNFGAEIRPCAANVLT